MKFKTFFENLFTKMTESLIALTLLSSPAGFAAGPDPCLRPADPVLYTEDRLLRTERQEKAEED